MTHLLGLTLLLLALPVQALVPVEGILMGEAQSSYQQDPLSFVFSDIYDKSIKGENKKLKQYQNTYISGISLNEKCQYLEAPKYSNSWMEKQAKRTVVSALQYIGLDSSIKAIGAYGKRLDLSQEKYKQLSENLVKNYCSKNLTVYSLRNVQRSLEHYYQNPDSNILPSVETSPFATAVYKTQTESTEARSKEFDLAIRNFRAFCSWGGDTADYRVLAPYLANRFIMAFIQKNLEGQRDHFDEKSESISSFKDPVNTVQISCRELICRKADAPVFEANFPRSIGSTGISTDLTKLYCHHFRYLEYSSQTVDQVRLWIKKDEIEHPVMETSFFISLMTGVPDGMLTVDKYLDAAVLAESSLVERWNIWAKDMLGLFSKDLLFEEPLRFKVNEDRAEASRGFGVTFNVTLGEMDQLMDNEDKFKSTYHLKLSKNYLRSLGTNSSRLAAQVDTEGQKKYQDEVSRYLLQLLNEKEKTTKQVMWNVSKQLAKELIRQSTAYRGSLFNSYKDEMLDVPVDIYYGVFALNYLRYRTDSNAGRLKLNL